MSTAIVMTLRERARKRANLVPVNVTPEDTARIADAVSALWEAENERLRDLLNSAADALAEFYDDESYTEEGLIQLIEQALGNGSSSP